MAVGKKTLDSFASVWRKPDLTSPYSVTETRILFDANFCKMPRFTGNVVQEKDDVNRDTSDL